jgi:hypothetical protein
MSDTPNLVCRSYDPHTAWYNKIPDEGCINGRYREFRGYDEIFMFPRNDCWQNFVPKSDFLHDLLSDNRIQKGEKAIYICDDFSWQSLTLDHLKTHLPKRDVAYGLTLLYLYEGHVSVSSHWDMGCYGGEMHDLWHTLPGWDKQQWGHYRCSQKVALDFYNTLCEKYPVMSHLWLHDKDMNSDWIKTDLGENELISTWIIDYVRAKI